MKNLYTIIVLSSLLFATKPAPAQAGYLNYDSLKYQLSIQRSASDSLHILQQIIDKFSIYPDTIDQLNLLLKLGKLEKGFNIKAYQFYYNGVIDAIHHRYESSLKYCQLAVEEFDKENKVIITLLKDVRTLYLNLNDQAGSLKYFQQKLAYYKLHGPFENTAGCYFGIGAYYVYKAAYNQAISNYLKNAEISKKVDNQIYENALGVIASLYEIWGNDDKARYYFNQMTSGNKMDYIDSGFIVYKYLYLCKISLKRHDGEALKEVNTAISYTSKLNLLGWTGCQFTKGLVFLDLKKTDSALIFLKEAKYLADSGHFRLNANGYFLETDYAFYLYYIQSGNPMNAEKYLQLANAEAEHEGLNDLRLKYLKELAGFYANEKPSESVQYYRLYTALSDSIESSLSEFKVAQYEIDQKDEQQQHDISGLKQERAVQEFRISRRNYLLWSSLVVLLLVSGLSLFIYRQLKKNRKTTAALLEAKDMLILSEKQLKAADEAKSRFFSNITHEFRTPLSLIIGPAGQMLGQEPSADWKKQVGTIGRNARQLLLLVNQLLDMAKLEAGSMKVTFARGNFHHFMQDEVKAFEAAAAAKSISLRLESSDAGTDHLFDPEKVHAIMSNLLSNAIKFTPSGGSVSVVCNYGTAGGQSFFTVTVSDSGIGIPAGKLPLIFDRFYQADGDSTRRYGGTGIGLSLAKELAVLMGGILAVKSKVSSGSTFILKVPFKAAAGNDSSPLYKPVSVETVENLQPVSSAEKADANSYGDRPLILVVEDNQELRDFIAQIFGEGYRVITAGDGAEGLAAAREQMPDLIISDLMMPVMDGHAFCTAVKSDAATDHIAFLLLTAKTSPASVAENLRNGADDYLTKPFVEEELLLRATNMLAHQAKLRAKFRRELMDGTPEEPAETKNETLKTTDPFLERLYEVIDGNLDDTSFSMDRLATAVNVSARTLNRKLAALVGMPAVELVKRYRLKKAAELLMQGSGATETAYKVGYGSPAHFSTVFKETFGVPPSEYKKQNRYLKS